MTASSAVLSFTDPYPFQAAIHGAQLELLLTKKGDFRAELTKITLKRLWMQRGDESLSRVSRGAISPHRVAITFMTDSDQPECRHCGTDVSPEQIIVNDLNLMHRQTFAACRWGSVSMRSDDLAAASEALVRRPVAPPPVTVVIRPPRALLSRLLRLHNAAGRLARTAPDILANPHVGRALENAVTHAMVMCLNESVEIERSVSAQRHAAIMAKVEEFLSKHESSPLYLVDICAAAGVSERTLRMCCREQLGMGPIRYLWLRRMHLTRKALARAAPGTSTVTRIAGDHGFWELGRFAVEYRALFGASPLETLRCASPV